MSHPWRGPRLALLGPTLVGRADRAEITGSREGAKPRRSDERRTIFRHSASRAGGVVSRQRPSGATDVVRPGGSGCQASARARWAGVSSFAGTGLGIDAFGWLLLFADIYNRTTTGHHRVTERTEDAPRLFLQRFRSSLQLCDFCRAAGQPRPTADHRRRLLSGMPTYRPVLRLEMLCS